MRRLDPDDARQVMDIAEWRLGPSAPPGHRARARRLAWIDLYRREYKSRSPSRILLNKVELEPHHAVVRQDHASLEIDLIASMLPARKARAIRLLANGWSGEETARKLGVSRARVSQIISETRKLIQRIEICN